ncbi:MAG: hypothetical protein ACQEUM_18285, partial [Pseudomonadota bacterium]
GRAAGAVVAISPFSAGGGMPPTTLDMVGKTPKQAQKVFAALDGEFERLQLLGERSLAFGQGIIVCTSHMARGLEFDPIHSNSTRYHGESNDSGIER